MRECTNPLKNIQPDAFTVIQASHEDFHKDLADIPGRYPDGQITYINNHQFVPLIKIRDEDQDRLVHLEIHTLDNLLRVIESDRSAILIIEYKMAWFGVDKPEELEIFNETCKKRAKLGGPVLVITAVMDRGLLSLDGKADQFFQIGRIEMRGKASGS